MKSFLITLILLQFATCGPLTVHYNINEESKKLDTVIFYKKDFVRISCQAEHNHYSTKNILAFDLVVNNLSEGALVIADGNLIGIKSD